MKFFKKSLILIIALALVVTVFAFLPSTVSAAYKNILIVDNEVEHGAIELLGPRSDVDDRQTVRFRVTPEEGYEVGAFHVYYRSDGKTIDVERVGFSEDYTFVVPKTNRSTKYIVISAEFVRISAVPHTVYVSYNDHSGKNSRIGIDRNDGLYLPGETVTVTIEKSDGSAFATDGLNASYYTDKKQNQVFLKDFPDYKELNGRTVTFSMPSYDVFLVCVFDGRKARITVEKYFEDEGKLSTEMSAEELEKHGCFDPATRIYNYEKNRWESCSLPVELYTNEKLIFESLDNSGHVYDNGLYVTGIKAYYTIDGKSVEEDLVDKDLLGPNRELHAELVMPGVDVTIRYTVRKLYKVETDGHIYGDLRPNISLALPGDVVKLTPYPEESWELSECIVVFDESEQTTPVFTDLTFIMPAYDVRINTKWRKEYINRHRIHTDVDGSTWDVFYSDSFFDHPAMEYDEHLSTLSMYMTKFSMNMSGPGNAENTYWYEHQPDRLAAFFKTIGFEKFEANEDYRTRTRFDTIGLGAASKVIGDYTLIGVVPRSGGYYLEWGNNVWLGDGTKSDYMHEGWYNAANKLIDFLKAYVKKHQITGKVKIWMAGYSRGGAVTNIAAALMDNRLEQGAFQLGNGASVRTENLFAYTFEAPQGANVNSRTVYAPKHAAYNNIWNIVNPNDLVPKVAMADFGFTRFGQDRYIATEFYDPANYTKNRDSYKALFGTKYDPSAFIGDNLEMNGISGDHYAAAMTGLLGGAVYEAVVAFMNGGQGIVTPDERKKNYSADIVEVIVLEELCKAIGSREEYVRQYQTGLSALVTAIMSDTAEEHDGAIKAAITGVVMSAIGDIVGVAVPFGVVVGELIDSAFYTPGNTIESDLVHLVKDVFAERPNELVTLATNIGNIFDNHGTDVSLFHIQAQDRYFIDLYNDTHANEIALVRLKEHADLGRVSFFGYNDLKLEQGDAVRVSVSGKLIGKSSVLQCDGGYAAGYYSYLTEEKMELFFPVDTEYKLTAKSYSKKFYLHDINFVVYCQYNSIGAAGTIKRLISRYDDSTRFNSDYAEMNIKITR